MRNLCQVDLKGAVDVAQAVLAAVGLWLPVAAGRKAVEFLEGAVPLHFEVDADAAVERELRKVEVEIGDSRLDDLGQHFVRLLVVRDAHLGMVVAAGDLVGYAGGEHSGALPVRQLKELVDLASVPVLDGHPWLASVFVSGVGFLYHGIEEGIERPVVVLVKESALW